MRVSDPPSEREFAAAAFLRERSPALETPALGPPASESPASESPAKAAAARPSSGCGSRGSAAPSPRASRSSAHSAYLRGAWLQPGCVRLQPLPRRGCRAVAVAMAVAVEVAVAVAMAVAMAVGALVQHRELRAVRPLEPAEVADEALTAEGVARHVGRGEGPRQESELVRPVPVERHALDLLGHGDEELGGGMRCRGEAPRRVGDRLRREAA